LKEIAATSKNNDNANDNDNDDEKYDSYDHAVYKSYVVAMESLLQLVAKHKDTIRRIVYTSSGAAGGTITARRWPTTRRYWKKEFLRPGQTRLRGHALRVLQE
jgi:hypothetical protein